jgi:hypothetical protein
MLDLKKNTVKARRKMKISVAVSTSNLESSVTTTKNSKRHATWTAFSADRRQKGRQAANRPGRGDQHQPEGAEIFLVIFLT